jgi:hypothetical protein
MEGSQTHGVPCKKSSLRGGTDPLPRNSRTPTRSWPRGTCQYQELQGEVEVNGRRKSLSARRIRGLNSSPIRGSFYHEGQGRE